jgi:predicted MFS family arabinose efflux permease
VTGLSAAALVRRYVALAGLRWLPVGLLIPVTVLLAQSRGLSIAQIGMVFAVQGLVCLALELPTGGLSDALGRRPVLILSSVTALASLGVLYYAHSVPAFVAALALQGVHRALDSGPLEAWYVDATLAVDPQARLERGLSAGNVVASVAIGGGALLSGALVALRPLPGVAPLATPLLAAIVLQVVGIVAVVALVRERRAALSRTAAVASVRAVPQVIGAGVRLLRSSRVLLALVLVEGFWSFGMVTFETLMPIKLADVVHDTDRAAALMGPVSSVAWLASAAGAAVITAVSGRLGVAATATALRVLQGLTVVGMGVLAGPVGVITAFVACYAVHGAANPLHSTLLHRQAEAANRTTVLSINSMVGQPAFAIGSVLLTAIADRSSVTTAIVVGAVVLAAAAPLYLPAWRAEKAAAGTDGDPLPPSGSDPAPPVGADPVLSAPPRAGLTAASGEPTTRG